MKIKSMEILLEERRDRGLAGKKDGTYKISPDGDRRKINGSIMLLNTVDNKEYYVTMGRCSCPDFHHRVSKMRDSKPNAKCKHQVILATLG